jgi:hypothetical protein
MIDLEGRLDQLPEALRLHQVVVHIGARGTGKTALHSELGSYLRRIGVEVIDLDAAEADSLADLNGPLAASLGCDERDLTVAHVPQDRIIRVIVENCHRLYDRPWLDLWQEQWRLLFNSTEARGRLGAVLIARPLFRKVAGGEGSPLLNAAVVMTSAPLSTEEIVEWFGVTEQLASALRSKTGGHPELTERLVNSIGGDIESIGRKIADFVRREDRYLMRLVEDHGLAASGILADLLELPEPTLNATLIHNNFASSYAEGKEALDDLQASGLIAQVEGGRYAISAELLSSAEARAFVRVPLSNLETPEPGRHAEASSLLFEAENCLRTLIVQALSGLDRAWWTTRVDSKMSADAESRRRAESDSVAAPESELHPMMYLSLGELFTITLEGANWRDAFRTRFRVSHHKMQELIGEVLAIRNKVAHNRSVSDTDLALLQGVLGRLHLTPAASAVSS